MTDCYENSKEICDRINRTEFTTEDIHMLIDWFENICSTGNVCTFDTRVCNVDFRADEINLPKYNIMFHNSSFSYIFYIDTLVCNKLIFNHSTSFKQGIMLNKVNVKETLEFNDCHLQGECILSFSKDYDLQEFRINNCNIDNKLTIKHANITTFKITSDQPRTPEIQCIVFDGCSIINVLLENTSIINMEFINCNVKSLLEFNPYVKKPNPALFTGKLVVKNTKNCKLELLELDFKNSAEQRGFNLSIKNYTFTKLDHSYDNGIFTVSASRKNGIEQLHWTLD